MTDSTRTTAADQEQRDRAIEPGRSCIVQAPAGSGKTETLSQRLLQLLGHAQQPEEIVAITFTRKAAREMRNRVTGALIAAGEDVEPEKAHERTTWHLARAALRQDRLQKWQLLDNPNRLRILTIDALCADIARRLPVTSEFGFDPGISDERALLYREAARETLALLESGRGWADDVERLLAHADNNFQRLEALIESMLARRDQWMRVIGGSGDPGEEMRRALEESLQRLIKEHLASVRAALPASIVQDLVELACHAADNLEKEDVESPIRFCKDIADVPGATLDDVPTWQGLAELLLVQNGSAFRKSVNKNQGFPSKSGASGLVAETREEKKKAISALLGRLNAHENFKVLLHETRCLPEPEYSEDQWEVLKALIKVLRLSVAQLRLAFEKHGEVDYIEKSLAALRALGETDNPTDLALALDARIQHLLIDEFQDTSFTQFELLRRLTAGWEPNDGRTLFVVGDPMQSIYRFREAEVGLFMAARRKGIDHLTLEPVSLNVNFRSERGIVAWVNDTFEGVLPPIEDERTGAVSFSRSEPFHEAENGEAVKVFPFGKDEHHAEARRVVQLVRQEIDAGRSVAILIRARSHLNRIIPELRDARIRYQSIEIDPLAERPVVQDLMALTRALLHTGDRIAWMAVLRAPWCGLSLTDFHKLIHGSTETPSPEIRPLRPIVSLIDDSERCSHLSEDGRRRIERVGAVLLPRLNTRGRHDLRSLVEGAWLKLGGNACYPSPAAADEAAAFFSLLENLDGAGDLSDPLIVEEAARKLFAPPDPSADSGVQIMTIHRAKGLEFDTVILPGLGRGPRHDDKPMLAWLELPRAEQASPDLLLAPMPAPGANDVTFEYIRRIEKQKTEHEIRRLLYVASTRAKKRLYLMGCADFDVEKAIWKLVKGSFLNVLWDAVCMEFDAHRASAPETVNGTPVNGGSGHKIHRLPLDWMPPEFPPSLSWNTVGHQTATAAAEDAANFWADDGIRHVGTVVHRFLQHIGETGAEQWEPATVERSLPAIEAALRRLGVRRSDAEPAGERVKNALLRAISDERGQWILSKRHHEIRNEVPISGIVDGRLLHATVDRTFVDADGTRWIIDYKTDGGVDAKEIPRERQDRYRKQLEAYGALFRQMENRRVRLGLYFPISGEWLEWE